MSIIRAAIATAILIVLTARAAQAQLEITPFVALHAPTGSFPYPVNPDVFSTVSTEQETAFGFGLGGRAWLDPNYGVQASLSRIGSDLTFGAPAHLTTLTAAALLRLPVRSITNPVWATLGAAVVARGGEGYEGVDGTTSVGGVLGIGTNLPVRDAVGVDLGFDLLVYPLNLERDGDVAGSSTQFDLRVRAGIAFTLVGGPPEE